MLGPFMGISFNPYDLDGLNWIIVLFKQYLKIKLVINKND